MAVTEAQARTAATGAAAGASGGRRRRSPSFGNWRAAAWGRRPSGGRVDFPTGRRARSARRCRSTVYGGRRSRVSTASASNYRMGYADAQGAWRDDNGDCPRPTTTTPKGCLTPASAPCASRPCAPPTHRWPAAIYRCEECRRPQSTCTDTSTPAKRRAGGTSTCASSAPTTRRWA